MPSLANLMNVVLVYGTSAEQREGPRYRQPSDTLRFGDHPLQALDLHLHPEGGTRPLLAFLHGGAWQFGDKTRRLTDAKVPFAHGEGWHFASLNFRQVPQVGVAEMARDAAAGVAALFQEAGSYGIESRRIVLMGHSSGAHLAALVASDPALLGAHGLSPARLAGVIANDGAAYLASEPSTGSRFLQRRLLDPAFAGADLAALSPTVHLGAHAGTAPPFLVIHNASRHTRAQALLLAEAVECNRGDVERHEFPGTGIVDHMRISRHFGRKGFGPTEVARAWLRQRLPA